MAPTILWFRRDLRLSDHPALDEALRRGGSDGVLPLFVLDDRLLGPCGPTRARYLAESLSALERSMGSPLCVRSGRPSEVLAGLVAELGARSVVVTADFGPEGRRRDEAVAAALQPDASLISISSPYVVDPGTLRSSSGEGFKVFSAFRRRWEALGPVAVAVRPELRWSQAASNASISDIVDRAAKSRPDYFGDLPDGPAPLLVVPGEESARARLDRFVAEGIEDYAEHRDLMAVAGTSRLSPSLRFGEIHPRSALAAGAGTGEGRRIFRNELCWREFYADVLFHRPDSVTKPFQRGLAGLQVDRGPAAEERFRCWALGETGIPLVDAAMRQLLSEGWMHNRARMVVASFLVKHLHLDWRWGARWFMWRLIDGDLASNQHGWQWVAGTGTDAAPFHRIFNPVAQAERFDPEGDYIRRYVDELKGLDAPQVLRPHSGQLLEPARYPPPMINLADERAEALRRYAALRQSTSTRS